MNLLDFLKEQNLKLQSVSKNEIEQLFALVERDLEDARFQGISLDRKFITAYNAGLQLATIVLRAEGYRTNPQKSGHHKICIQVLPLIMGRKVSDFADFLNACRLKRHACEYTCANEVNEKEVEGFLGKIEGFHALVIEWLKKCHPQLLPYLKNSRK